MITRSLLWRNAVHGLRHLQSACQRYLQEASPSLILLWIALLACVLRLPFLFRGIDYPPLASRLTTQEEAVSMLRGFEVLHGYLPYLRHWDHAPPESWYIYGILMLVSFGTLTLLRLYGIALVVAAAFVLYRTLADARQVKAGLWAAGLFVVLASTLPGAQSVTPELVATLPLSLLCWMLLSRPAPVEKRALAGVYTFCVLLLPSFIMLLPALVWLWAQREGDTAWQGMARRAGQLLAPSAAIYGVSILVYVLVGEASHYFSTVFDASFLVYGPWFVVRKYAAACLRSSYWLIPLFLFCFVVRAGYRIYLRDRLEPLFLKLLLLLFFAALMLWARCGMGLEPRLLVMVLPVLCLAMGMVPTFSWRDGRMFMLAVTVLGLVSPARMALHYYPPLLHYMAGDHRYPSFYNDHDYSIAHIVNTGGMRGRKEMFLCEENAMLYALTGTEPFDRRLGMASDVVSGPRKHTDMDRAEGYRRVLLRSRPVFVVARVGGLCTHGMDDVLMQRYVQLYAIDNTGVYLRGDIFSRLSALQP